MIIRAYKDDDLPETLAGSCSVALGYADCEQPAAKPRREGYTVRVSYESLASTENIRLHERIVPIIGNSLLSCKIVNIRS